MQLEQEIDLILGRKDIVKTAMHDWTYKWVPAILERAGTLKGKATTLMLETQKKYEGMIMLIQLGLYSMYSCRST